MGFGQGTGFTATAGVVIVVGVARSSPAMAVSGRTPLPVSASPGMAVSGNIPGPVTASPAMALTSTVTVA